MKSAGDWQLLLPLRVVVTILECCVTFSGVKLSIRSFVLFIRGIFTSLFEVNIKIFSSNCCSQTPTKGIFIFCVDN